MVSAIHEHGYWQSEGAERRHLCSPRLASWLTRYLDRSLPTYDFGCGLGTYLLALQQAGFTRLRGFEGDPPKVPHFKGIEQHDLTTPLPVSEQGNVICLEVAEHVPAEFSATLINTLVMACADRLVFSWALRGQGGEGHVNELDNFEVLPAFMERGFSLDMRATREARDAGGSELGWFKQSILVMRLGK